MDSLCNAKEEPFTGQSFKSHIYKSDVFKYEESHECNGSRKNLEKIDKESLHLSI